VGCTPALYAGSPKFRSRPKARLKLGYGPLLSYLNGASCHYSRCHVS